MNKKQDKNIKLIDVTTNNLKSLSVSFPLKEISVVTGCSGSGKSSLVFHSLFAESQRRYLESLSSFSRQYIKAEAKPKIKEAQNLLPAIAIKQARASGNNRSTVGSLTETGSLLELIFYHLSEVSCPSCHETIKKKSLEEVTQIILNKFKKEKSLVLLAPLSRYKDLNKGSLLGEIKQLGYSRLWSKEKGLFRIETSKEKDFSKNFLVIDRLAQGELEISRLLEGCKQAFQIAGGTLFVLDDKKKLHPFSKNRTCLKCDIRFDDPKVSLFSFNSPLGACENCQGYGQSSHINWEKVLPENDESLASEGLPALDFGSHRSYYDVIKKNAKKIKLSLKKAFKDYTKKEKLWLKEGSKEKGKEKFEGLQGYFDWLERKKYKPHYRMHLSRFKIYKVCKSCDGERYREEALWYKIGKKNIAEILRLNHGELSSWLEQIKEKFQEMNGELSSALEELEGRLLYLKEIGLSYLSSNRLSNTLSGGELQRIKMSRCLGNHLTQTLFCLDEPSSGLHPRDTEKLIKIIKELKAQGNTVVVVEHEKSLIEQADHLLLIGPNSGHKGGNLIFEGKPSQKKEALLTKQKEKETEKKKDFSSYLEIKNASIHNLKKIDVKIPLEGLVGVCGVSGSGKTSLIRHTLFPLLCEKLYKKKKDPSLSKVKLVAKGKKTKLQDVFFVSQEPITRSSRSTIATYLGIFDDIRKTYGSCKEAKALKLTNRHFSFNSTGGRCENCKGKGTIPEELSFLGSVNVVCGECSGKRFTKEVLSVKYKGYSILDLLGCSVKQLETLFPESKKIQKVVKEVSSVGLDYITLGQELSSFSGGEAQRLKLLSISLSAKDDKKACLIFDEPTSGLSDSDVETLLEHFQTLKEAGHTVIVVEHHTGLLKSCDWLIELGPEASHEGGQLVFEGPAYKLKEHPSSITAPYI